MDEIKREPKVVTGTVHADISGMVVGAPSPPPREIPIGEMMIWDPPGDLDVRAAAYDGDTCVTPWSANSVRNGVFVRLVTDSDVTHIRVLDPADGSYVDVPTEAGAYPANHVLTLGPPPWVLKRPEVAGS